MPRGYYTYGPGPVFYQIRDITKDDIYAICKELTQRLNVQVLPVQASEGGLLLCTDQGYKCLRFSGNQKWPGVKYRPGKIE